MEPDPPALPSHPPYSAGTLLMPVLVPLLAPPLQNLDTAPQGLDTWHSFHYLAVATVLNRDRWPDGMIGSATVARFAAWGCQARGRAWLRGSKCAKSGRLKHLQDRVGIISSTGGLGKRRPVLLVERNRFVDDLAQLGKYRLFVMAVAPTVQQSGTTADKALVFVRPFNNLYVLAPWVHCWAASRRMTRASSSIERLCEVARTRRRVSRSSSRLWIAMLAMVVSSRNPTP